MNTGTEEHKKKVEATFDTICEGYDNDALRFFIHSANELLRVLELQGNERLVDIAAGTGNITLRAANILNDGQVTALDLSQGMLEQARSKAEQLGLNNIEYRCGDLEALEQPETPFDVATCGFGIFFLPDMHSGLKAIKSQLAPGGRLAITSFLEGMMEPQSEMFLEKVEAFGIEPPPLSWKRIDTAGKAAKLLEEAGYKDIEQSSGQMGYHVNNAEDWWQVIWNSGYRGLLMQLGEEELQRFRSEHLADVQAHATGEGIWLDVPVLFTRARVAST